VPPRRAGLGGFGSLVPPSRDCSSVTEVKAMLLRRASPASQIPSSKIGINFCTDPKLPQGSLPHSHCSIRRGEHCFWVARVRRHLPFFQWSNPSLKDHLALFTHGVVGQWTI